MTFRRMTEVTLHGVVSPEGSSWCRLVLAQLTFKTFALEKALAWLAQESDLNRQVGSKEQF